MSDLQNLETLITPEKDFFKKLSLKGTMDASNNFNMNYVLNLEELRDQGELLKLAIKNKVDIKKIELCNDYEFPLEWYKVHKEVLLAKDNDPMVFSADDYLKLVLLSRPSSEERIKLQVELVEEAIKAGANVNSAVGYSLPCINEVSPLGLANNIPSAKFLRENGAKLTEEDQFYKNRLVDLVKEVGGAEEFIANAYKNLDIAKGDAQKIPYTIHHIWLTHPSSPREIYAGDIQNVINTKNMFAKNNPNKFAHIVWTNDKNLIPQSIEKLEQAGIKVESIYDSADGIRMFGEIERLIDKKLWGMASDALRASLMEIFGGLYTDLDFTILRDFSEYFDTYDFFACGSVMNPGFFQPQCFAARPNHKIITDSINFIKDNLLRYKVFSENNQDIYSLTYDVSGEFIFGRSANEGVNVMFPNRCREVGSLDEKNDLENVELSREKGMVEYADIAQQLLDNKKCLNDTVILGHDGYYNGEVYSVGHTWYEHS